MKTSRKLAITLLFTLSAGSTAFAAETLTSPFDLELTSNSVLALLGGFNALSALNGEIQTTLPDTSVTNPIPVAIDGIHLDLKYAFATPTPDGTPNEWALQSQDLSATMVVDTINASQTITETVGPTTVTVTINAVCTDVQLALAPGKTEASGKIQLTVNNGVPSFNLVDFAANWAPGAWTVTSLNCTGPSGITAFMTQQIEAQLQTINPFLGAIQSDLQAQLNAATPKTLSWTLAASDASGVSADLTAQSLTFLDDGSAFLQGTAAIQFPEATGADCPAAVTSPVSVNAPTSVESDDLIFPEAVVPAIAHCAYANGSLKASLPSNDIPGFSFFRDTFIGPLFIWPDLLSFSTKAVFDFDFSASSDPTIGPISGSGNTLNFSVNAPIAIDVTAPEHGQMVPYVDFSSDTTGQGSLTVSGGKLTYTQKTQSLKLKTKWDPTYVKEHHPDQWIWTSIIADFVKSALKKPGVTVDLPAWNTEGVSMTIENASLLSSSNDISLGLNIQQTSRSK